jgi:hypothetical protein
MARVNELPEKKHDHPPHLLDERFYVHANYPRNKGGAYPKQKERQPE